MELEGNDRPATKRHPSTSTDERTRTSGVRRIRNMNQRTLRASNKKSKKDENLTSNLTDGKGAPRERLPSNSDSGCQVTPSPKPGQNIPVATDADTLSKQDGQGNSRRPLGSHSGLATSSLHQRESVASQRLSSQPDKWPSSQPSSGVWGMNSPPIHVPMLQQVPQAPQPASIQKNKVFGQRLFREGAAKRPMQTTPPSVSRQDQFSWKKARVRQEKVQQRAFVNKRDNPFSSFKHDPNDSESFLDALSSSSKNQNSVQSSIIPPEGLQALQNAYSDSSIRRMNRSQPGPRQTRFARNMQRRSRGPSVQDILMEKEREMYRPALTGTTHRIGSRPGFESPTFASQPPPQSSWQDVASPYASSSAYYDTMQMNIPTSYPTMQHSESQFFGAQSQQFQPHYNNASQLDRSPVQPGFDEFVSQVDLSMAQSQACFGQLPYHSTPQTPYWQPQGEPFYSAPTSRPSANSEMLSPANQGLYGPNSGGEPNFKYQTGQMDEKDIEAAFF